MGMISGILLAVGGFISSIATTVGPVIASAATALATKLPMTAIGIKLAMDTISTVISKTAEMLGIAPAEENHEELGAKAMQEDIKPREEFESTQEYLDYLRKDVELDKEKYTKMSEEEKISCRVLGTTMVSKSIEEKAGVEISPDFLITIYKAKLGCEQVEKFINVFADHGITSMDEMAKYITNELPEERVPEIGEIIETSVKELSPSLSNDEIMQEVVNMKRAYNESEL